MLTQGERLAGAFAGLWVVFTTTPPGKESFGTLADRGLGVIPYLFTCSPPFDMVNATSEQRQRQRTSRA